MTPSLRPVRSGRLASAASLAALALAAFGAAAPSAAQTTDPWALVPELYDQAVFSCTDLTLNGGATIDSQAASGSATFANDQGHVVTNGNLTVNGGATIRGNALYGPGKSLTRNGNSTITGTTGALAAARSCAPIDLAALASSLASANDNVRVPRTSGGRDPLSGANRTVFSLNANDTITLPAGTYYFTSFTLNGNSTLAVSGPVQILCTGNVTVNGNAQVNTAGSPFDLKLWISGSQFTLNGGSTAKAIVYKPSSAGAATLNGGSRLYGSVFAGRVDLNGNARVTRVLYEQPLTLTYVCGNRFRVRNPRPVAVYLTYQVVGTAEHGSLTVPPAPPGAGSFAETTFETAASGTVRLFENGVLVATAVNGGTTCGAPPLLLSVTEAGVPLVDGTLFNRNVTPVATTSGGQPPISVTATLDGAAYVPGTPIAAEGLHTLVVTATDAGGPPQQATKTLTLRIDKTAPTVVISSPSNGQIVATPAITVTGSSGDAVSVTVNGAPATLTHGGGFEATGVPLTEGTNTLQVRATDEAGNVRTVTITVVLDTQPPAVAIDSPANGAAFGAQPIAVSGTVSDATAVTVTVNGVAAPVSGGRFTAAAVPLPAEGSNALVATATDGAGNVATSATVTAILSPTAPVVTITSPAGNAVLTASPGAVTGTVVSPNLANVKVNGVPASVNGQTFTASVPLVEGSNGLVAVATDTLDRTTTSSTVTVSLDTLAPVVTIDASALPAITKDVKIAVRGTVSDPHLDATSVKVNGVVATVTAGATPSDPATFVAPDVPLVEGTNSLVAQASDTVGHAASSAAVSIERDTVAPLVAITSPATGATFGTPTVAVTGTASDAHLSSVMVNGVAATLSGGGFTATISVVDGSQTITAVATDVPGNVATSTAVTITVDIAPPSVVLDPPAAALVATSSVTVTGYAQDPNLDAVTVNGVAATRTGPAFTATVALQEGVNQIVATATDTYGRSGVSAPISIELDATPPAVSLDAPAPGACFAAGAPAAFSGRYGERHPPAAPTAAVTLEVQPPGASAFSLAATLDATGRLFTASAPSLGAVDGVATLLVTAVDALGLTGRQLASYRVDATTPAVSLLLDGAPFPGSGAGAAPPAGTTPTLFSRAVAPRAAVTDGAVTPPAATFTLDGAPYLEGTPITAEGAHLLVARAVDCAGHEGAAYASFSIDLQAPHLLSTTPADAAVLGAAVTTFSGTSDPDLASATVNGVPATVSGASFSVSPFAWREGANAVSIELVDAAGNRASFARSFTVKTLLPTVSITEGGAPIGTGAVYFAAVSPVVTTNDPANTVTATLNGQPFTSGTSVSAAGDYTLTATATDVASHTATATATFTIDLSAAPTLTIAEPAEAAVVPGPTVAVRGTVSAALPQGPTTVSVNGRAAVVTGTTWSVDAFPLLDTDGPNDLVAVATDARGRTASASVGITARSGGPTLLLLEPADGSRTNRSRLDVVGAVVGGAAFTADGQASVAVNGGAPIAVPLDARGFFRAQDVALADGANTIVASARDTQNRTGSATAVVTTDRTAPTISITANGQAVSDGATFRGSVTLTVAVADAAGPAPTPTVRLNGQAVSVTGASVDVPVSAAGGYVLSVVVRDAAGNEARAERSFVVDTGSCGLADIDPAEGESVAGDKVTFHGRSGTAATVVVRVPAPGTNPVTYTDYPAQLADGTFAAGDVPVPAVGDNAYQIVCTDRTGASSTLTRTIKRLAAGGGPAVAITSPADGAKLTAATLTVAGSVSDGTAKVFVNGRAATVAPISGGAGTWSVAVGLAEGPNVLAARAVDATSRVGVSRVVVQRDSLAPKISIARPTNGTRLGPAGSAAPSVDVTGTVELDAEENLASVVVSTPAGSVTATVNAATGAFFAANVPLSGALGAGVPQRVTATAGDTLGQTASSAVDVTFDPQGPAIRLSAPQDLFRVNGATPGPIAVTGEAWAADGGRVSVNGSVLEPATLAWEPAAADGRRHTTFGTQVAIPSAEGLFGVVARVEDPQGGSATDRRTLLKDVTAPTVVETVPASGATQVDANAILLVLFSEPVEKTSLSSSNGLLLYRGTQPDAVVGTYSVAGNAVAFVPGATLAAGESYRLSIGTLVRDLTGNALGSAQQVTFTVAVAEAGAAPVLDAIPALLCASSLDVKGTTTPSTKVRVTDGELVFSATSDSQGRFKVPLALSGSGWHHIHAVAVARDGTESPEATALFRVDCNAPQVVTASFDRTAGRVTVLFSEAMNASTLTLAAPGAAGTLRVTDAEDASRTAQAGTLSLSTAVGGATQAAIDLGTAPDAWWRTKSVRLEVTPPAADLEGNALAAPFEAVFFLGAGPGDLSGGFLSGEAYDDATGRPLDGVAAKLYASGAATPTGTATTDGRGRYALAGEVPAGRYAVVLEKPGYTRVTRRLPLAPATGAVPFDGRLTPLAPAVAVPLATGGTVTSAPPLQGAARPGESTSTK